MELATTGFMEMTSDEMMLVDGGFDFLTAIGGLTAIGYGAGMLGDAFEASTVMGAFCPALGATLLIVGGVALIVYACNH